MAHDFSVLDLALNMVLSSSVLGMEHSGCQTLFRRFNLQRIKTRLCYDLNYVYSTKEPNGLLQVVIGGDRPVSLVHLCVSLSWHEGEHQTSCLLEPGLDISYPHHVSYSTAEDLVNVGKLRVPRIH